MIERDRISQVMGGPVANLATLQYARAEAPRISTTSVPDVEGGGRRQRPRSTCRKRAPWPCGPGLHRTRRRGAAPEHREAGGGGGVTYDINVYPCVLLRALDL